MALWGARGALIGYGNDYQVSGDGTVINDAGDVFVKFKLPIRSNTSSQDPQDTLTSALTGLDSDDTLYGTDKYSGACQILVTLYGNYYWGSTSRLFNIQTHHTDQASPTNRVKISTVWTTHWRGHSGWNTGDIYPAITSSNSSTGEFKLKTSNPHEPDYFGQNYFEMFLLNGTNGTPYVGNLTYDSRYGQDQAWK